MINNKCFYVYCQEGFVAFVWADTSTKAKGYAWRKSLGACDEFCKGYDYLKTHRCHTLDNQFNEYVNFASLQNASLPDRFIDFTSHVGCAFLIVFAGELVSLFEGGDTMVFHHSAEARKEYDLKALNDWF